MNKSKFLEILSNKFRITKIETNKIVNIIFKTIMQVMKNDKELKLIGFGTFKIRDIKERSIKTPNGKMVKILPYKKVVFFNWVFSWLSKG